MLEFHSTRKCKARKIHFCDICKDMIGIGEQYVRFTAKYQGDFFDLKQHVDCSAVVDRYCDAIGEYEYDPDEVHDWLRTDVCRDLCAEEERDDCLCNPFMCPKVLVKLGIKKEEG